MLFGAPGPTVVLNGWTTFILTTAAVLGAITAIGVFSVKFTRTVIRPAVVLSEIATRFSEGYEETISKELRVLADHGEKMATNQASMLDRLDALNAKADAVNAKADEISGRLSETRHKIIGEFQQLKMGGDATLSIVEALERTAAKLHALDDRLASIPLPLPDHPDAPDTPPH